MVNLSSLLWDRGVGPEEEEGSGEEVGVEEGVELHVCSWHRTLVGDPGKARAMPVLGGRMMDWLVVLAIGTTASPRCTCAKVGRVITPGIWCIDDSNNKAAFRETSPHETRRCEIVFGGKTSGTYEVLIRLTLGADVGGRLMMSNLRMRFVPSRQGVSVFP